MIYSTSIWLGLSLSMCAYAWFGRRYITILPIVVILAAIALWGVSGTGRYTKPPEGKYEVLGADIVPGVSIGALLKSDTGSVVYYIMPWSDQAASNLQGAMDNAKANGGGNAHIGVGGYEDGVPGIEDQNVPTGDAPKVVEQPQFTS